MAAHRDHEGLSIGYRVGFRLRLIALTVFGPADLGADDDPRARLERERASRVAAKRAARGEVDKDPSS